MGNVIRLTEMLQQEKQWSTRLRLYESAPVRKAEGSFAYAGTVLEEGELTVKVKEAAGSSRYE